MKIEDGSGKAVLVEVSAEKRIRTESLSQPIALHNSLLYKTTYHVYTGMQAIGTSDYGLLAIRNDGDLPLLMQHVDFSIDATETVECKVEAYLGGTWVAGTAISEDNITNLNSGSANTPDVTAHYNSLPTGGKEFLCGWFRGPTWQRWATTGLVVSKSQIFSLRTNATTAAVNAKAIASFVVLNSRIAEELNL